MYLCKIATMHGYCISCIYYFTFFLSPHLTLSFSASTLTSLFGPLVPQSSLIDTINTERRIGTTASDDISARWGQSWRFFWYRTGLDQWHLGPRESKPRWSLLLPVDHACAAEVSIICGVLVSIFYGVWNFCLISGFWGDGGWVAGLMVVAG